MIQSRFKKCFGSKKTDECHEIYGNNRFHFTNFRRTILHDKKEANNPHMCKIPYTEINHILNLNTDKLYFISMNVFKKFKLGITNFESK